jgi:hypothetical protein
MLINKTTNETGPSLYDNLTVEAQVLFDTIMQFWSDEEQLGFNGTVEEYRDIQYSSDIFTEITGSTVEDIFYDLVAL